MASHTYDLAIESPWPAFAVYIQSKIHKYSYSWSSNAKGWGFVSVCDVVGIFVMKHLR